MTRAEVEAAIYARIDAEHHDVFYRPTNAEWRESTGQTETMRASDRDYIYALADFIVGRRASSPSTLGYNVRMNGADGSERLRIIQKIGREVRAVHRSEAQV